jgi:LL-diaminopimelate aminotransferase
MHFCARLSRPTTIKARGCHIAADEIFVSDGAKSDSGNIQEIFSGDCRIAVCDPVYPVYVDSNIMAGRTGTFDDIKQQWSRVIYMPCTAENGFCPELPEEIPDIIYICSPNNPTGTAMTTAQLQKWVDFANEHHSVIIFDAAYEAYISESGIPHSIYECSGAETCAIEIRSFSKNAGFTGVRLGFTVVPRALKDADGVCLRDLWARRHGTKFNGAPYIQQKAGEAVYSAAGQEEVRSLVSYYMENAAMILKGLEMAGYTVYGGINAPYIWLQTPRGMSSWEFFDYLLGTANIVGTPGSGFGPNGEGYFRLTAFGTHENTKEAMERLRPSVKVLLTGRKRCFIICPIKKSKGAHEKYFPALLFYFIKLWYTKIQVYNVVQNNPAATGEPSERRKDG